MPSRTAAVLIQLIVFALPLAWLALILADVGIEQPSYEGQANWVSWPVWVGVAIGWAGGLLAGFAARDGRSTRPAFVGMSSLALLNSWWIVCVVLALNSTSARGIAWPHLLPTVQSWCVTFAVFYFTAALVPRAGS